MTELNDNRIDGEWLGRRLRFVLVDQWLHHGRAREAVLRFHRPVAAHGERPRPLQPVVRVDSEALATGRSLSQIRRGAVAE